MKGIVAGLLVLSTWANAQSGTLGQFAIWKPKEGKEENFEAGYKKHLDWHRSNGDTWDWYGWFFTSGPRTGTFLDATLLRRWADLDYPVKPAEDRADNLIHTVPFADLQTVFRGAYLPELSVQDSNSLRLKYLCLITIETTDVLSLKKLLSKTVAAYSKKMPVKTHLVFRLADGGSMNHWFVFLGANTMKEFGAVTTGWMDAFISDGLFRQAVTTVSAERLTYRDDLSLIRSK